MMSESPRHLAYRVVDSFAPGVLDTIQSRHIPGTGVSLPHRTVFQLVPSPTCPGAQVLLESFFISHEQACVCMCLPIQSFQKEVPFELSIPLDLGDLTVSMLLSKYATSKQNGQPRLFCLTREGILFYKLLREGVRNRELVFGALLEHPELIAYLDDRRRSIREVALAAVCGNGNLLYQGFLTRFWHDPAFTKAALRGGCKLHDPFAFVDNEAQITLTPLRVFSSSAPCSDGDIALSMLYHYATWYGNLMATESFYLDFWSLLAPSLQENLLFLMRLVQYNVNFIKHIPKEQSQASIFLREVFLHRLHQEKPPAVKWAPQERLLEVVNFDAVDPSFFGPSLMLLAEQFVRADPLSYLWLPQRWQADVVVARRALSAHGELYLRCPRKVRNDYKCVLAAVSSCGSSLENVPPRFRGCFDIALAAVLQNRKAFRYASAQLRSLPEFVGASFASGEVASFADDWPFVQLSSSEATWSQVLALRGSLIVYCPPELLVSGELYFVAACQSHDPMLLVDVPEKFCTPPLRLQRLTWDVKQMRACPERASRAALPGVASEDLSSWGLERYVCPVCMDFMGGNITECRQCGYGICGHCIREMDSKAPKLACCMCRCSLAHGEPSQLHDRLDALLQEALTSAIAGCK